MLPAPRADLVPNTFDYELAPLVKATGFREYDARWLFGPDINLLGGQALDFALQLGIVLFEVADVAEVGEEVARRPKDLADAVLEVARRWT